MAMDVPPRGGDLRAGPGEPPPATGRRGARPSPGARPSARTHWTAASLESSKFCPPEPGVLAASSALTPGVRWSHMPGGQGRAHLGRGAQRPWSRHSEPGALAARPARAWSARGGARPQAWVAPEGAWGAPARHRGSPTLARRPWWRRHPKPGGRGRAARPLLPCAGAGPTCTSAAL